MDGPITPSATATTGTAATIASSVIAGSTRGTISTTMSIANDIVGSSTMIPPISGTATKGNTSIMDKAAPVLNVPIQSITWIKILELCYALPDDGSDYHTFLSPPEENNIDATEEIGTESTTVKATTKIHHPRTSICFHCKSVESCDSTQQSKAGTTTFKVCSKCNIAKYCCRTCQVQDWKKQHKRICDSYQRMKLVSCRIRNKNTVTPVAAEGIESVEAELSNDNDYDATTPIESNGNSIQFKYVLQSNEVKSQVRDELFGKMRFYICSYAVLRYNELGRGFLFIQYNLSIENHSIALPINCYGQPIPDLRTCLVHYITLGEYDQEVCRNDFEMTLIRKELYDAIQVYDPMQQVVVFMRFRCGHCALGLATLVPDYKICHRLGRDYYYDSNTNTTIGSLQLNLDE